MTSPFVRSSIPSRYISPSKQGFAQLIILLLLAAQVIFVPQPVQTNAHSANSAQEPKDIRQLEVGKPIEREMAGGENQSYQIRLAAGQYLSIVVEQRGIDVVVTLFGPDGNKLVQVDSPNGIQGLEPLKWIVETAGIYRLEVGSLTNGAKPGRYEAKIVELRATTSGDRDLVEADKLYNESVSLGEKRQYSQAISLAERALALHEKTLGSEHRDTANSLDNLAYLYYAKSDYLQAEPLYRRTLAIREKTLGAEHPSTVSSLNNLARLYRDKGDYAQAEPLYRRALTIREKTLGVEHPGTATSLDRLATLYRAQGDYAQAEALHRRALAICEKTLGAEHPATASSLNNLANLCDEKGDYVQAEVLHRRALAIREKTLGAEHPDTAASLNNLAFLYNAKGDYEQAEPLFRRALAIWERTRGAEHPTTIAALGNLANLYYAKGDYAQAEPLHRRALAISEKTRGAEHLNTANPLDGLAYLHNAKGDYVQAEPLFRRALAIREKTLGAEHPGTAFSLNNLAALYYTKGDYAQAEPIYQRALAIREKAFGAEHPAVAESLNALAQLYESTDEVARAVRYQSRASLVSEHNLVLNLATGSERQKLAYLAKFTYEFNRIISLHIHAAPTDAAARSLALTTLLQRKGRVLDAMSDSFAALRLRARPQDQTLFNQLQDTNSQLAWLVLNGPQRTTPDENQKRVKALEEQKEDLEAKISQSSDEFRAQSQPVTLASVQSAIPANAALVEFVVYRPFNAKYAKPGEQFGPPRYAAYLLRPEGEPQGVELDEAKAIDAAIEKWREALRNPTRNDVKRLARRVEAMVMQPVRTLLGETQRVLISPDGALNLIPFAALVDEQNRHLVERFSITYLTSGRDLLRLQVARENKSDPLIVADPDFGALSGEGTQLAHNSRRPTARRRNRGPIRNISQAYFEPLPETGREAKALKTLLPQATVLTKEQATEAALKKAHAPSILHIATHGFFLEDSEAATANARIENPLMRSGLALAGFNQHKSGDDDGALTALEAAGLDFWGTKLVVLSACDTGVGEVKNGEGVYGLRRALVLAGSESQVMSLWSVSDYWTRRLMVGYYTALQQGQGRGAALRQVQLQLLNSKTQQHPYYWASFIQSGEWANLDGKR